MNELWITLLGIVSTLVASYSSFLFGKRKNKAETVSVEVDNYTRTIVAYQNIIDDFEKRLTRSLESITERDRKIEELTNAVHEQNVKIETLMRHVDDLTDELKKYKQLNGKTP